MLPVRPRHELECVCLTSKMSELILVSMRDDPLMVATANAAAYARNRGDSEIMPDDLLLGALQAVASLRVIRFDGLTIDLSAYPPVPEREDRSQGPRYSQATAALFDEASAIARGDGEKRVRVVHLLAALGNMDSALMRDLAAQHDFGEVDWRAALSTWDDEQREREAARKDADLCMSVEDAAEALGVHQQTIRGYIKSGKLPAFRIAGERAIRVLASDLYGLLEPLDPTSE